MGSAEQEQLLQPPRVFLSLLQTQIIHPMVVTPVCVKAQQVGRGAVGLRWMFLQDSPKLWICAECWILKHPHFPPESSLCSPTNREAPGLSLCSHLLLSLQLFEVILYLYSALTSPWCFHTVFYHP